MIDRRKFLQFVTGAVAAIAGGVSWKGDELSTIDDAPITKTVEHLSHPDGFEIIEGVQEPGADCFKLLIVNWEKDRIIQRRTLYFTNMVSFDQPKFQKVVHALIQENLYEMRYERATLPDEYFHRRFV